MTEYKKSTLDNGVVVVTEKHPESRAVCAGIWVCSGTRDEALRVNGISHFIEHLVFKGTKKRSAFELAKSLEAVGGDLNAYTSREYTCFHGTSLRENLRLNMDVLSDLVCNARFAPRDFERERLVVLQEIAMTLDTPEEYIFDAFLERVYGRHALGRPILGSPTTLQNIKRSDVVQFYRKYYNAKNVIVSAAGNLEHDRVCDVVENALRRLPKKGHRERRSTPKFHSFVEIFQRETEQVHLLIGVPATSFTHKRRFEAFIINALLGGGMTSHLYQSVRERRGLAYSVYSQLMTFMDTGLILIYAGTEQKQLRKTAGLIMDELQNLRKRKLKPREIELFKKQVRGSILLGADDLENRMNSLGINEMVFGGFRSVDEVIADVEAVTVDTVKDYIERVFDHSQVGITVMGQVSESDEQWLRSFVEEA